MIRRDLRGRYKASVLGFLWTFLNPLFQLFIYTMVFSIIMRANIEEYKAVENAAMKFVITDLIPGTWQIKKDGKVYIPAMEVRSDDGILSFEGTAGHYEFLR